MLFCFSFLSLSCLPRGAPGRNANIENSFKSNAFYNEFAWVAFLRQVQREQISEHRHTQNYKKNTCKNRPRDVSTNHQQNINFAPPKRRQKPFKIAPGTLSEAAGATRRTQDAAKSSKRDQKDPKSEPRAFQERREAIFRATTFPGGGSAGLGPDRRGGVGEGL